MNPESMCTTWSRPAKRSGLQVRYFVRPRLKILERQCQVRKKRFPAPGPTESADVPELYSMIVVAPDTFLVIHLVQLIRATSRTPLHLQLSRKRSNIENINSIAITSKCSCLISPQPSDRPLFSQNRMSPPAAMASIAVAASVPTFTGLKAETKAASAQAASSAPVMVRMAPVRASAEALKNVGKALLAASTSLVLVASANAATVKMGGDDGSLGFFPNSLEIPSGETVTFVNNKGFPHNVVFDEDAVPAGVKVESLNHEDYLNAANESFSITFKTAGTYEYYCEPHQGAGMTGKITVS